ncbi:hypothetical protein M2137_000030 [Parabacteroides sp. PFB2-10]|nr:hypothetical protein [Parabacteroides sp. PFB2-10]
METAVIQNRIYEIRGQRVMLDFDLAEMYGTETRILKQAVRRNIDRFPDDFLFRLSSDEANLLIQTGVSRNVIPKEYNIGGSSVFAFTELMKHWQNCRPRSRSLRSPEIRSDL